MATPEEEIAQLIRDGRTIEAVKKLRTHTGIGLKEAKTAVDDLAASLGVSGVPDDATPESLRLSASEVDNGVRALLREKKALEAVQLVRDHRNLGMKEARLHVEQVAKEAGLSATFTPPLAIILVLAVGLLFFLGIAVYVFG